jgi:hypothetical protein
MREIKIPNRMRTICVGESIVVLSRSCSVDGQVRCYQQSSNKDTNLEGDERDHCPPSSHYLVL